MTFLWTLPNALCVTTLTDKNMNFFHPFVSSRNSLAYCFLILPWPQWVASCECTKQCSAKGLRRCLCRSLELSLSAVPFSPIAFPLFQFLDFLKLIYHFNEISSQGSTLVSPPCDLEIASQKKTGVITNLTSFVSLWSGTICCLISENSCSTYFVWFSSYLWRENNTYSSSFLLEKGEVLIHFNNKSAFIFHSQYSSREKTGFQSQRWWY